MIKEARNEDYQQTEATPLPTGLREEGGSPEPREGWDRWVGLLGRSCGQAKGISIAPANTTEKSQERNTPASLSLRPAVSHQSLPPESPTGQTKLEPNGKGAY